MEVSMDALTKVESHDLRLVALHPGQLEACQQQLIQWAEAKVESENERCRELKQNFEAARVAGIKTDLILKHLNLATKRAVFFAKVGEAVKAGYYIIPNMPMDVFAVRRSGKAPRRSAWHDWRHLDLGKIEPEVLPAHKGDYVNPRLAERYRTGKYKNEKGEEQTQYLTMAAGYRDEIDFPFALAKPEVLTATQHALALKVFDELGVMPGTQERRSDPMVIGRIRNPGRKHDRDRDLSFLIAWFLDTDRI
jgi:hypothetical protein